MSESNLAVMREGQYSNESKGLPSWGRDEYEQSEEQLSQKPRIVGRVPVTTLEPRA